MITFLESEVFYVLDFRYRANSPLNHPTVFSRICLDDFENVRIRVLRWIIEDFKAFYESHPGTIYAALIITFELIESFIVTI